MKTVTKLLMGAAVLAASAGAANATTTLPSTDNSNLLFFVNDASTHSTYTAILSQDINGSSGYFTNADALTPGATPQTLNTIKGDANFSYNFSSDTALQSFISSAKGAGDNLQWGIIGAAYSGPTPIARATQGNALVIATSTDSASIISVGESGIDGAIPADINTDAKNLNVKTFDAFNGTTQGVFGTSGSSGGTNLTLYGNGVNMHGTLIGTTSYGLYGLTTNGTTTGYDIAYSLGSATFDGTTLSFTGNPTVTPLPAAAWLFGSGLLGLLGIGRRRDRVAA